MSEENTTPTVEPKKQFKPKGSAFQPKKQLYFVKRGDETIKDKTEMFKIYKGVNKLSREDRGALAFFSLRYEGNSDSIAYSE